MDGRGFKRERSRRSLQGRRCITGGRIFLFFTILDRRLTLIQSLKHAVMLLVQPPGLFNRNPVFIPQRDFRYGYFQPEPAYGGSLCLWIWRQTGSCQGLLPWKPGRDTETDKGCSWTRYDQTIKVSQSDWIVLSFWIFYLLTIKKGGKNGTCKNKLKLVAEYF